MSSTARQARWLGALAVLVLAAACSAGGPAATPEADAAPDTGSTVRRQQQCRRPPRPPWPCWRPIRRRMSGPPPNCSGSTLRQRTSSPSSTWRGPAASGGATQALAVGMEITEDRWYLKQYDLESGVMVAEVKIPGA